ncbi:hypothetical protein D3C80_1984330 [compost metagenome]
MNWDAYWVNLLDSAVRWLWLLLVLMKRSRSCCGATGKLPKRKGRSMPCMAPKASCQGAGESSQSKL